MSFIKIIFCGTAISCFISVTLAAAKSDDNQYLCQFFSDEKYNCYVQPDSTASAVQGKDTVTPGKPDAIGMKGKGTPKSGPWKAPDGFFKLNGVTKGQREYVGSCIMMKPFTERGGNSKGYQCYCACTKDAPKCSAKSSIKCDATSSGTWTGTVGSGSLRAQ